MRMVWELGTRKNIGESYLRINPDIRSISVATRLSVIQGNRVEIPDNVPLLW
jgi:hypothetical protein